jgi:hypothetical protein
MKFLVRHNAYVNIPMHRSDDPVGLLRQVPTLITASPTEPHLLELPDDTSLDNISSKWEPQDEAAVKAQVRLKDARAKIAADATVARSAGGLVPAQAPAESAPPAKPSPADIVDALLAMPSAERSALLAAAAERERKARSEAETAGTMSGAVKAAAAQKKP